MQNIVNNVISFHLACDIPVLLRPEVPATERVDLRWRLIDEEVNKELSNAMNDGNLALIADAIADSIYVLVGTAIEYGIPLARVWNAVQSSNMNKINPITGKVRTSDGTDGNPKGKVLKPAGWLPPDIEKIIKDAMNDYG